MAVLADKIIPVLNKIGIGGAVTHLAGVQRQPHRTVGGPHRQYLYRDPVCVIVEKAGLRTDLICVYGQITAGRSQSFRSAGVISLVEQLRQYRYG